ncbi:peptidase C14 caspase catalytic subunit p20 (plasmid) [Cylindrospermum sp. NIES-4074]|nr:peptidase C14 caspase catalytic subunit p20 [Cylindrospermum sp. NIES-4074]
MTSNLYALLVGIDKYPNPNDRLEGCVNDIKAVEEYLEQWLSRDSYQLHIKTLLESEATRDAIIQGFQQHLSQANSNDVVLFYYSGHGSQEKNIPEELWRFEPDRKNETLYCYDSSLPGHWHLADKELAKLIAKVAKKEPHICIILDCCHSGSGTKDPSQDVVERQVSPDKRFRPLNSYIFNMNELEYLCRSRSSHLISTGWEFPQGKHILMAACEDHDTAKELMINGKKHGIFSYCLLEILKQQGKLTYRELWQQTKNGVSRELAKRSRTQFPQLETTPPGNDILLFLDGAIAQRAAYFTVRHDRQLGWVIDGGAIHGVQPPAEQETTVLALFKFNCNVNDLKNPDKSIGEATVREVLPQLSKLDIHFDTKLSTECIYKAIVISLPLPTQGVYIEGDEVGVNLASKAINSATTGKFPSIYIRSVPNRNDAQLYLQCCNQEYLIRLQGESRPLITPIQGFTLDHAKQAIERLEHIARWMTIRDLLSPPASRIQPDDIEMELLFEGENNPRKEKEIRQKYQYKEGKWQPPRCTIKLTNHSQKTLYCTILALTDRFAIVAPFFEAGYVRLEPGQIAWAGNGNYIKFSIEPELRKLGITEAKDVLKLIVSTSEFDARLSTQDALDMGRSSHKLLFKQSTLNRLMNRAQFRLPEIEKEEAYDDWYTKQVVLSIALSS